jgi:uncharacterized protein YdbL (DUF1318 family)
LRYNEYGHEILKRGKNMRKRFLKAIAPAAAALAIISCITVNIYFPEGEIRKTAEEIVNDVRGGEKKEDIKDTSFSLFPKLYAQQETEVTTPKIRALKESMKARLAQLVPHFEAGRVGEANGGFLQALNEEGLGLQDRAVFRKLVKDENQDRTDLYAEVAKATNVESSQIQRIQKIFAEYWISSARTGWTIQKPDGTWVKK